jgi:hypothetical protein
MSRQGVTDSPDDPIGYFLEDIEYQGKSTRTQDSYARVLREFESTVSADGLDDLSYRECMSWIHSHRESHDESSVAT